jgi:hypothetical protein
MTIWIIRSEVNDVNLALEIAADQRNKGYKVWIEDENGGRVDEGPLKSERAHRSLRNFGIGALFWLGAVTVLIGGLYLVGVWVDGVW